METIIKHLIGELSIIAQAPVTFLAALLVAGAVIWWAMDWRYSGIVANRDSEISSLKIQRDEYKDKAGGASPDEMKKKLDDLAEMTKFTVGAKWRSLTPKETTALQQKFAAIPPKRIQVMYTNYRGKDLAQSFADILKASGWTDIHFSEGGGLGTGVSTGRGNGTARALKEAIEASTDFKVGSFGPDEPEYPNAYFIAVGINTN
ncbi:hypothetical protein ASD45_07325 [Pseudolabrys sp. Root1462]|uniref:hypothetical protein n=1 Tax=Pseudolabrys sp. Root1462 TaxID=1736466 RepID=UPI000702BB43|nr:hypothetical protein [Pseudolabrys sp. Root1462]KQZ00682.1 hypothetical protein ASD45_07325 [Pseudolabrys sp. Root1462]